MKKGIHPVFYKEARIVCNSCNTVYTLGSTIEELKVELCSNCHPFYTGKEILVDRENLVEKFNKKKDLAVKLAKEAPKKKDRKTNKVSTPGQISLKDMLSSIKQINEF